MGWSKSLLLRITSYLCGCDISLCLLCWVHLCCSTPIITDRVAKKGVRVGIYSWKTTRLVMGNNLVLIFYRITRGHLRSHSCHNPFPIGWRHSTPGYSWRPPRSYNWFRACCDLHMLHCCYTSCTGFHLLSGHSSKCWFSPLSKLYVAQ